MPLGSGNRTVAVTLQAHVNGYLANIQKAQVKTQQFADSGFKSIGKHEQSISKLSTTAGLAGAALGAGLLVAVKSSADFEAAMSDVAATGEEARVSLGGLRETAIQAGKATKFSATEAAGGIESLAKAGLSAKDIMGGGLTGALNLAAVGEIEVAEAADIAAIAMKQFNLTGADVPHIADLLAAGAGKATGEVSDMAMALKQSGLVASQFGVSLEENVGTLAAFANAGLLGSDAGTSFKTMLLQLASPSGEAADEMERLGIAAYDANGNFVGITDLAEQLKQKMGPLAQAERDAALATIFGNDAVRAANVLYKEGGTGIANWTKQVDDAGFAARAAAIKMDNLKGDVEQLSGSVETALIGLGGAGQGPLRELTQNVTGLVNSFSNLPASAQGSILTIGALAAGGLLAVAGLGKLAIGINNTRDAFNNLAPAGSRARGVMFDFGKAAGVATLALGTLRVWGAIANEIDGKFTPSVDDAVGALLQLGDVGNRLDIDNMFRTDTAVNDIDDVGEAIRRAADPRWFDQLGMAADKLTGTTYAALTQTRLNFEAADKAISALDMDSAADSFARLRKEAEATGTPVEELVKLFPQYAQTVRQAAQAQGVTVTSAKQLADLMSNGIPPAADQTAASLAKTANSTDKVGDESKEAKKQLDEMVESMFAANKAALELDGSEDGLEAAIDDAAAAAERNSKAVRKNRGELSANSEKGRENREALRNLAAASINYRERLIAQGAKQGEVTKATDRGRTAFIKSAEKMGYSSKEANKLADKYGLVDKKINELNNKTVKTKVTFSVEGSGFKIHIPNTLSVVKDMGSRRQMRGVDVGPDRKPAFDGGGPLMVTHSHGHGSESGGGIVHPQIASNTFPDPKYTANALRRAAAARVLQYGTNAIKKQQAQFMPAMSSPSGSVAGYSANMIGTIAAMKRAGARNFTTYPGHHPSMARARDVTPHSWKIANTARASSGVWYVIYQMRIASKNHGNTWRPFRTSSRRGDWQHRRHVHVAWYGQGTERARRGLAVVGEHGPELLNMQGGERVTPVRDSSTTRASSGGGWGGTTVVHNHYHFDRYVGNRDELVRELVTAKKQGRLDVVLR